MAEWVGEKPISCPCGWETFVSQRNRNDLSGASPQRSVPAGLRAQTSTLLFDSAPLERLPLQTCALCPCSPVSGRSNSPTGGLQYGLQSHPPCERIGLGK